MDLFEVFTKGELQKKYVMRQIRSILLPLFLSILFSCKKDKEKTDNLINVVVSNFRAESVRVVLTDTLENIIYYDKVLIDDDRNSDVNIVEDSFTVPREIPRFLYKMRLEGPRNSLVTVNLNHDFGSVSRGIGGVVTNDPNNDRYWVKGSLITSYQRGR